LKNDKTKAAIYARITVNGGLPKEVSMKEIIAEKTWDYKVVHTKRQYHVSNQGLSKSYYNIEMNTINSLSDKMMLLVNTLRKMGAGLK
jgi:hypothetical protein